MTRSKSTVLVQATSTFSAHELVQQPRSSSHSLIQGSMKDSLHRHDWINYGTLVIKLISSFGLEGGHWEKTKAVCGHRAAPALFMLPQRQGRYHSSCPWNENTSHTCTGTATWKKSWPWWQCPEQHPNIFFHKCLRKKKRKVTPRWIYTMFKSLLLFCYSMQPCLILRGPRTKSCGLVLRFLS